MHRATQTPLPYTTISPRRLHGLDRAPDGLEPRTAQPVHCLPRDLDGQPRQEQGHAGDVAVVLARLVRAPEDDVVDAGGVDPGPLDDGPHWDRRQVVSAYGRQRPPVPPNRRTVRRTDV